MCKIPKVVIVAPAELQQDLRRKLSSFEYDISATVGSPDEAAGIGGDVAVAWEPDEEAVARLREAAFKTVAIAGDAETADMKLVPDDVEVLKTRIWELFRPPQQH